MHIKQITISNFRSFRRQPEIHPFSPGLNAVVGRNGSGKSNLFDAVQFVLLSPRFYTLRQEERQALLHEGSGSAAVNAFVEIVFDNSDNRFSLENSDEVVLRRTVGHKKDEFFLQRKRANKNEIMSLLEGAGFSKSNPYFIVQQGKVNALCTMTDAARLQLLKQVAGTTVYDEKKAESQRKMEENFISIEKINEVLEEIEKRLTELRGEKEELTQYQAFDRQRRAMEYTLYDKELRRAREMLDDIEHNRSDGVEKLSVLHEEARVTHDAIRSVEATAKAKASALRRNGIMLAGLETDKTNAMKQRTLLELECKELEEAVTNHQEVAKANKRELAKLEKEIEAAQAELKETVQPEYDNAVEVLARMTNERDEAKKKMEGLYAKQGRGRQFSSREDRDAYLRSHIEELEAAKAEKESQLVQQQESLANLRRSVATDTKTVETEGEKITKKTGILQSLNKTIDEKKRQRLELNDKRRDEWRKSDQLKERVKEARANARQAQSDMRKVMPRATSLGLNALETIVQQENLVQGDQYFGMLMDNFELVDPKFRTAVEVAAQNSLFHVIVDTDATAAKLMSRLERDKLGRVTFLPLNRLRVDQVTYPDSSDVTPLLDHCVRYDVKVDRAMRHVFGKKLLARSVDVASTWSAKCNMDAITLDGDLCSRKGALTGGYVDLNKSRLRAQAQQREAQQLLTDLEAEHRQVERKAQEVDQTATNVMGELQRLEAKQADLNHQLSELERDMDTIQTRITQHEQQAEKTAKTTLPTLQNEIESDKSHIGRLQQEMATELTAALSEEERTMLSQLKAVQVELAKDIESQSETVDKVSAERQRLQSLLDDNLLKRRQELLQQDSGDGNRRRSRGGDASAQQKEMLEQRRRELEDAIRSTDDVEAKLKEARRVDNELRAELRAAKSEMEKLKSKDMQNQRSLEEAQESGEKLLNKRSVCVSKRETYMQKIQELGSLPPTNELANYTPLSISALMRQLEGVNKKLKKYSHVNKKAYDQYVNFSEQRESLLKRKEELDSGAESVKELVESLDRQKDEAINRTFRGVSAHFKDVFKELVPNGAGELVMKTAMDDSSSGTDDEMDDSDDSDSDDDRKKKADDSNNPSVSLYRGVGIKVRFSAVGENYLMSQLSGGQKALVAMALIFAIQRCDPAPFYLFDELDQALDSTHRAAVASLIERQASSEDNPTQFIVSTFRPELVSVAHRCYGISHQNKVSNIHHLSKKDALHFIANLMSEEEAVGDVTSLATSRASRLTSGARKRKAEKEASEESGSEEEEQAADAEDEGESP